ncbi:MAG: hypothetical protein BGP16_06860 [Sphingobium sp. 66-54]|nr:MAG: hypothetical protein BGP16_06860 [Sphingobium sp. 66-54]
MARVAERARKLGPLFFGVVVAPTVVAVLYYGLFASDVYISESRFVVRAPERSVGAGSLGVLLRSAGWGSAGSEVYAARDYILSRDALKELNKSNELTEAYSGRSISIFDRFNSLGMNGSKESLYQYYLGKVSVGYDSTSSIMTLQVRAYAPQDAHRFNSILLRRAENLVNGLNVRAQTDLIRLAQSEVDKAQKKVTDTGLALARFRDRSGVVDPGQQASVQLQMISKLQDELIATRLRLVQLKRLAADNPQVPVLEAGIRSLQGEIEEETAKIVGGRESLAGSAVQYQRVLLDNQFAEKQLAAAMAAFEEARSEALRKQAYIERIVEPSMPDEALEPGRIRGILTAFAVGLVAWGVISMLVAGVREHRD